VAWLIVGDEPEDVSDLNKDASVWLWEIEREGERRYVEVTITLPSLANIGVPSSVRSARESRGRTAVEAYLNEEEPPWQILVSTQGISA
jgi:hypothetical protein